jgi:hypothetical protein
MRLNLKKSTFIYFVTFCRWFHGFGKLARPLDGELRYAVVSRDAVVSAMSAMMPVFSVGCPVGLAIPKLFPPASP